MNLFVKKKAERKAEWNLFSLALSLRSDAGFEDLLNGNCSFQPSNYCLEKALFPSRFHVSDKSNFVLCLFPVFIRAHQPSTSHNSKLTTRLVYLRDECRRCYWTFTDRDERKNCQNRFSLNWPHPTFWQHTRHVARCFLHRNSIFFLLQSAVLLRTPTVKNV